MSTGGERAIDVGDSVRHGPTGEAWLVACVDGDRLHWIGWPEGTALISDCVLIEKASAEKRLWWLREIAASPSDGHRQLHARKTLTEEGHASTICRSVAMPPSPSPVTGEP